jgi:hypothetical protein
MPWPAQVAPTLNAAFGSKQGLEDQHIGGGAGLFVSGAMPDDRNGPAIRCRDGDVNPYARRRVRCDGFPMAKRA